MLVTDLPKWRVNINFHVARGLSDEQVRTLLEQMKNKSPDGVDMGKMIGLALFERFQTLKDRYDYVPELDLENYRVRLLKIFAFRGVEIIAKKEPGYIPYHAQLRSHVTTPSSPSTKELHIQNNS